MYKFTEFQVFIIFYIIGIIIAFIFDFFKALRKVIKHNDKVVFLEDIIFIILSGILIFLGIFKINSGIIRLYLIISIILGIAIYSLTISKFCVIIFSVIVGGLNKIITFILNITKFILAKGKRVKNLFIEYFIRKNRS